MGATQSTANHEPLDKAARDKVEKSDRPRRMDRLRRSLRDSFRKKKDHIPESSKPHQWQADEAAVRAGTCTFHVKYLGCVEVFESRGMQICEEALKLLRNSRRRPVRGILYISGDGLRVVDDETKGLIVDQTIEKVSFCAPDRNHEKGFSYICRDGTTRRWMCHGFLAIKESGERLSHAVGCAFAVCLERKQKRDKECGVTMTFDHSNSTFTRTGSFRAVPFTERIQDPQECKPADPPPLKAVVNPFAIERPHATATMLQRQGSFRGFQHLNQQSPFKRQLSLRLNELPSTLERQQRSITPEGTDFKVQNGPPDSPQPPPRAQRNRLQSLPNTVNMSPIPEASPVSDRSDAVSALCQQVTQGLSLLSSNTDDPFAASHQVQSQQQSTTSAVQPTFQPLQTEEVTSSSTTAVQPDALGQVEPIKYTNPWENTAITATSSSSDTAVTAVVSGKSSRSSAGMQTAASTVTTTASNLSRAELWLGSLTSTTLSSAAAANGQVVGVDPGPRVQTGATQQAEEVVAAPTPRKTSRISHLRSQSLGSAEVFKSTLQQRTPFDPAGQAWSATSQPTRYTADPFDAEWATLAARSNSTTNPFTQNTIKAFEVQM